MIFILEQLQRKKSMWHQVTVMVNSINKLHHALDFWLDVGLVMSRNRSRFQGIWIKLVLKLQSVFCQVKFRNYSGTLSMIALCSWQRHAKLRVLFHSKTNFIFGEALHFDSCGFQLKMTFLQIQILWIWVVVMSPWPNRSRRWLNCHHQSGWICDRLFPKP